MGAIKFSSIDVELVKGQPLEQAVRECILLSCNSQKVVRLKDIVEDKTYTVDSNMMIDHVIMGEH